jgi:predicted ATPase
MPSPPEPTEDFLPTNPNNLLIDRYNQFVASKQIKFDKHQHEAALKLNTFYNKLMTAGPAQFQQNSSGVDKLVSSFFKLLRKEAEKKKKENIVSIKSVYLYGGVGK